MTTEEEIIPPRCPDEIMEDFWLAANGQADFDMNECLWEIIDDILTSVKLAEDSDNKNIYITVKDYVANHYGD